MGVGGYWFKGCYNIGPCLHTDGITSNIYPGSDETCCCVDEYISSYTNNSDECIMSTSGSYTPYNYEYCSNKGADGYCSIIPFCVADGETQTSFPCSCTGDKILSTCYAGETCDEFGECCDSSSRSCSSEMEYTPEGYLFKPCPSNSPICENTDGLTINSFVPGCCCVDLSIDAFNNSDWCSTIG